LRIDVQRIERGLSKQALVRLAGIGVSTYDKVLRGRRKPSRHIVIKLRRALDALSLSDRAHEARHLMLQASYRATLCVVAGLFGIDAAFAVDVSPHAARGNRASHDQQRAHEARQIAIYLANQIMNVSQADLARIVGVSPAAISMSIRDCEDRRDERAFNQVVTRAGLMIARDEVL
jgi:transcriptional regulator with XRE-family HTH domain